VTTKSKLFKNIEASMRKQLAPEWRIEPINYASNLKIPTSILYIAHQNLWSLLLATVMGKWQVEEIKWF